MAKMNIEATKGKIKDIQGNIERGQKELQDFEKRKQDNYDARMNVERSDMAEEAQKATIDALAQAREKLLDEGDRLSQKLDGDRTMLEQLAQDVQTVKEANDSQLSDLEKKKADLDKMMGIGSIMDKAIGAVNDSQRTMGELQRDISEAAKNVANLQSSFSRK